MRPLPVLLLALLVGLAVAPGSATAQGDGGLAVQLVPAQGEASNGGFATTMVNVHNPSLRPVLVRLHALANDTAHVTFGRAQFEVLPGQTSGTSAAILVLNDTPVGTYLIGIVAQEDGTAPLGEAPMRGAAEFRLDVVPPPPSGNGTRDPGDNRTSTQAPSPPPPSSNETGDEGSPSQTNATADPPPSAGSGADVDDAPPAISLSPRVVDVDVAAGGSARVAFAVRNQGGAGDFTLAIELPTGWRGELDVDAFHLDAGQTRTFVAIVSRALDGAPAGEGRIVVGGDAQADIRLRLAPTPAPRQDAPAPPQPAPVAPRLRVEPDPVQLPPGGGAMARIVVAHADAAAREVRPELVLPPGVTGRVEPVSLVVEPNAQGVFTLVLQAQPDAQPGALLDASLRVDGASVDFTVHVVEPPAAAVAEAVAPSAAPGMPARIALALAAVGVGVAAAVAAAGSRGRWRALLSIPLFTRLRPSALLDHPRRRRVARAVEETPGVTIGDLQARLGMANGALRHHLDKLEEAGIVRSVPDGRQRRLYAVGAGRVEAVPPLPQRVLGILRDEGPQRAADLAQRLGVSRQALHYHLKRLEREGHLQARHEAAGGIVVETAPRKPPSAAQR